MEELHFAMKNLLLVWVGHKFPHNPLMILPQKKDGPGSGLIWVAQNHAGVNQNRLGGPGPVPLSQDQSSPPPRTQNLQKKDPQTGGPSLWAVKGQGVCKGCILHGEGRQDPPPAEQKIITSRTCPGVFQKLRQGPHINHREILSDP